MAENSLAAVEKLKPSCSRADFDLALEALPTALAHCADEAEAKIRAMGIEPPERCASCAFTAGTFPNTRAPATALDALKCLVEDHPFGCHHDKDADGKPTRLCAGFRMVMAAETGPKLERAPWSWSDELAKAKADPSPPLTQETTDGVGPSSCGGRG